MKEYKSLVFISFGLHAKGSVNVMKFVTTSR